MPRVEHYSFGRIVIDGKEYTRDVIVFWDRIRENWWRKEGHRISLEDIREIIEARPEIVIFGTGAYGVVEIDGEVLEKLGELGAEVIARRSSEACEIFNREIERGRRAVLAIHLTC